MLVRYALLLTFSVLSLASCQITRSAVTSSRWEFTSVAATDSTEAVVLMHSSQGPEATPTTVTLAEAQTMSAVRAKVARR